MTELDPRMRPLSKLAALARQAARRPVAPEVQRRGREQIVASAELHAELRAPQRLVDARRALLLAACVLAAAAWFLRPQSLSYEVRGGLASKSSYVGTRADVPAEITFSDGSQVKADPGTQLRIGETQSDGARIFVERGAASAHVVHREHSRWLFEAGPFEIRVTGTRLRIAWDPAKEELDLSLQEGSVEVRSPIGQQPISVRAGQRFLAKAESSKQWTGQVVQATPGAPAEESAKNDEASAVPRREEAEQAAPPAPDAHPYEPPASSASAARGKAPAPRRDTWQSLVARGEFEAVIAAANAKGIDGCLGSCAAPELRALADAARYTKRLELAEKCLLALRQRFAGSGPSAAAAFLLGRTSELRGHNAQAEHWYELYLAESADGEFASDALAGRMRVVTALRGKTAARPLAVEYLRRYPDGVYASSARKIVGEAP
ncbi:MAG: FecR domain-containing protein [Polyangiales bacterium]